MNQTYTSIHCRHCGARLPWAFLIDGKDQSEKFTTSYSALPIFAMVHLKAIKRYAANCGRWQAASTWPARYIVDELVDPDAPEIQRLLARYKQREK